MEVRLWPARSSRAAESRREVFCLDLVARGGIGRGVLPDASPGLEGQERRRAVHLYPPRAGGFLVVLGGFFRVAEKKGRDLGGRVGVRLTQALFDASGQNEQDYGEHLGELDRL